MSIRFAEIHASDASDLLNHEWVVLENVGTTPFTTRGCGMTVGRRGTNKKSALGVIDPGFVLNPGDKMRMCTGSPGTESHGTPPEDDIKNYYLFLPRTYLKGEGAVLTLTLRGLSVAKATFAPTSDAGVAP